MILGLELQITTRQAFQDPILQSLSFGLYCPYEEGFAIYKQSK